MSEGIPVGRIFGLPLRVHWSVLVITWLFTWSLASTLPQAAPGHTTGTYWLAGICGAVVLLASLLAHELTHALVARRAGVEVLDVTLWLFGGVARLGGEARSPREAFRIAASGPAMSLSLAGLFAAAAAVLNAVDGPAIVAAVGWWLAGVNLVLALFNMLPGAPLDGGRVLRAILWRIHGDPERASIGAARAGRVVAFLLIVLGLVQFLAGAVVGGAWTVFIGWFMLTAARQEEQWTRAQRTLAGVTVAHAMTPHPRTVPGWISVEEFIQRYLLGDRHSSYPVEGADGTVIGLITLEQLRRVAPGLRDSVRLADVAVPLNQVATAAPDEPVTALLERLEQHRGRRALVLDRGRVVGIVTAADLARLVEVMTVARNPMDLRPY
ncbi:site-2 protease family protein [uncultured Mycolicibacterium sp.]|uniref:site-2 protease family protein n=1 Tax=uncultured Mycolicibacterium sp. TaxID=2320817 RepID=UPI0026075115|nr:site-2 protease family protein [uncultured Mycolicibacterium sp.]